MSNEYLDIAMKKVIKQEVNAVLDKIIAGLKAHKWDKDEGSKAIYNSAINDAITYVEEYKAERNDKG